MSKISIDDIPFEGAELSEAELGEVAGGRMTVSWRNSKGQASEWWVS
ncbi:putative ATP-grasp target RiPP [Streptosporangium sp. NBC_01755]|nr:MULTISPECIES: putative ATP-grasp target RiPP [unclassified Streptosporangium]WSA27238.1 putative ATP-grasp target RiPP [Streptosporangium sp. NBC_01810]WSD01209.1 putative ATP-grasp target RiPP [Streptosporangium sp. NBC_01755]